MTRLFERAVVAGVGLLGGSFALAARRAGAVGELVGLGRSRANLELALERGIVDRVSQDAAEAGRDADLALLAVPVASLAEVAARLAPVLAPAAVITDVGSVKGRVGDEVTLALAGAASAPRFVGAHPIAGTEESGAAAARVDLFEGSLCIVTPRPDTDAAALERVEALWRAVGCTVERMEPGRHDEALAWVSHVPHMLAFALAASSPAETHRYAGPSFRDATRVAASPVEMWRDIVLFNREALGGALDAILDALRELREAIGRGDAAAASEIFARAREARRRMDRR